ncbi:hypothetical protein F0A16_06205 [Salinicola corii]|uniref:Type II secretion system protein M n=1 Tax=Salinicola corii TaxID=2606937 RepID=A0A640WHT2_9GAMM|nr:hypothetical protein [Salinicola corii]KAA0019904.1 hypothetical protein F0A16_06205 [Salinicola corii]
MMPASRLRQTLSQIWAERSAAERRRLAIALPVCVLLLGYLIVSRSGIFDADTTSLSVAGAASTSTLTSLPAISRLDTEAWRQSARRNGIALTQIAQKDSGWQLAGQFSDAAAFTTFSHWAAKQGWWATQWQLQRDDDDSLHFTARFVAYLEEEATP